MSQIEAVFFDCDGTLVDSEVICSRAYVTMFREFGTFFHCICLYGNDCVMRIGMTKTLN